MSIRKVKPFDYPFTEQDCNDAFDKWGCNCGPTALAAMLGVKLDVVHPVIPKFDERHYTNPSMMLAALAALNVTIPHSTKMLAPEDGKPWRGEGPHQMALYGLNRIQWEGPWYGRFAYHKSHWVGSIKDGDKTYIFDCNGGWRDQDSWEKDVVPILTEMYKRSTGGWHVTHRWELEFAESRPEK